MKIQIILSLKEEKVDIDHKDLSELFKEKLLY